MALPGIGRKTAERLVLDMRDRVEAISDGGLGASDLGSNIIEDAVAALVSLGYKQPEVSKYVDDLEEKYPTSEEIIRQVLKNVLNR